MRLGSLLLVLGLVFLVCVVFSVLGFRLNRKEIMIFGKEKQIQEGITYSDIPHIRRIHIPCGMYHCPKLFYLFISKGKTNSSHNI